MSDIAQMLPDRCEFTLRHCERPMKYAGSRSTWQGQFPNGTSTVENRYTCETCNATLDLKIVEPDQPGTAQQGFDSITDNGSRSDT